MRDHEGPLTPAEETVVAHLQQLAGSVRVESASAFEWVRAELSRRLAADAGGPRELSADEEAALAAGAEEAVLQGACGVLDQVASTPARASFLEYALRYTYAGHAHHPHGALEPPPDAPGDRSAAFGPLNAWALARGLAWSPPGPGVGEEVVRRGAAAVHRVLFGQATGRTDTEGRDAHPLTGAGFWRRAGAYVLDLGALYFVGTLTTAASVRFFGSSEENTLMGIFGLGFFAALLAGAALLVVAGGTPGRLALGLEVRRVKDGARLGAGRALLRQFVGEFLNVWIWGAGIWTSFLRPDRRTWADLLSSSCVVRVGAGRARPMLASVLVLSGVLVIAAWTSLSSLGTRADQLVGELETLFDQANKAADTMNELYTREVESDEEFVSDLENLLVEAARYDSLARLQKQHIALYSSNPWAHPAARRQWRMADSLVDMRLAYSATLQRWAAEGLRMSRSVDGDDSDYRRRMFYLASDAVALDGRIRTMGEFFESDGSR